jgi:hypothetical protein
MKHTCKAPNCTARISTSLLMCAKHWAQVPKSIQIRVVRNWRALSRGVSQEVLDAYEAARVEAIQSVTKPKSEPTDLMRLNGMSPSGFPLKG